MRVKNCRRFEGCGGGVLPKIACNLLKIRVTTSKKQSHSRPRPPPHWMGTPSPFPPFCCKYAAGPPGLVPDLLKRWPRWCAGSDHHPEPPPLVPSCCPPSVAGGVAADILKRCRAAGGGAHRIQNRDRVPRWCAGVHGCRNR